MSYNKQNLHHIVITLLKYDAFFNLFSNDVWKNALFKFAFHFSLSMLESMKQTTNSKLSDNHNEPLLLSHSDLVQLTGCKRVGSMIDWLKARSWVFEQSARRGQVPIVCRLYFFQRMGVSLNVTTHSIIEQKLQQKPKLDFLKGKK